MSSDYLARLKAQRPDVDWDAEMEAARERRRRQWTPWQRFRHWVHARKHPSVHREKCSECQGGKK